MPWLCHDSPWKPIGQQHNLIIMRCFLLTIYGWMWACRGRDIQVDCDLYSEHCFQVFFMCKLVYGIQRGLLEEGLDNDMFDNTEENDSRLTWNAVRRGDFGNAEYSTLDGEILLKWVKEEKNGVKLLASSHHHYPHMTRNHVTKSPPHQTCSPAQSGPAVVAVLAWSPNEYGPINSPLL